MRLLEAFYESTPRAVGFIERKTEIPSYTFNLYGAPKTGKTWLVLDYLSKIPKRRHLYIDMRDLRIDKKLESSEIDAFIESNEIETVVIDHCDNSFSLPKCKQTIVVSEAPYRKNPLLPLLEVGTLDFEEYIAFEKRHIDPEHSFSYYLRTGSLPNMTGVHESILTLRLHENIRSILPTPGDLTVFKYLSYFQGKPVTAHQLYEILKREHKISKDRIYKTLKGFEERRIISWIPKLNQPKAAKRVLFYDFAIPASLHFEKSLMGQLYTIAASKLLKRHHEIVYTDKIDFFDPATNRAILISPFTDQQSSAAKIPRLIDEIDKYEIMDITILTIVNSFEYMFEKVNIKAVPFYEWMLQD